MKKLLFIILTISLASCVQHTESSDAPKSTPQPLPPDTVNLTGLLPLGYYEVTADTSYFFTTPDSAAKSSSILLKNALVEIYKVNGSYAYAAYTLDSANAGRGWLKASELKRIFFTPPKIINSSK